MPRFPRPSVLALFLIAPGCRPAPDPVVGSFVNDEFSTNRLVFHASGRFEHYGANDDGSLQKHPALTGTFTTNASRYVVTIPKGPWDAADSPTGRVYRILAHEGLEYLFDERGAALRKFEQTRDARELRHAWRREGG